MMIYIDVEHPVSVPPSEIEYSDIRSGFIARGFSERGDVRSLASVLFTGTVLQSQKAVSVYLTSKQILPM